MSFVANDSMCVSQGVTNKYFIRIKLEYLPHCQTGLICISKDHAKDFVDKFNTCQSGMKVDTVIFVYNGLMLAVCSVPSKLQPVYQISFSGRIFPIRVLARPPVTDRPPDRPPVTPVTDQQSTSVSQHQSVTVQHPCRSKK